MFFKRIRKDMSILLIMALVLGVVPQTTIVASAESISRNQGETVGKTVYGEVYLEGEYYNRGISHKWDQYGKFEVDNYDDNEELQKYFKKVSAFRDVYDDYNQDNSRKCKRYITLGLKRSDLLEDIRLICAYAGEPDGDGCCETLEKEVANINDMKVIKGYKEKDIYATDSKIEFEWIKGYFGTGGRIKVKIKRKDEDEKTIEIDLTNQQKKIEDIPTNLNMDIRQNGLYEVQVRGLEIDSDKIEEKLGDFFSCPIARYRVADQQKYLEVGIDSLFTMALMNMEIYADGKKVIYTQNMRKSGEENIAYYKVPIKNVDSEIKIIAPFDGDVCKTRIVIWKNTFKKIEDDEKETEKEIAVKRLETVIAKEIEDKEKYTEESYKKYENTLKNAKEVNKEISEVEEIKRVVEALEKAIEELKIKEELDEIKAGEYEIDIQLLEENGVDEAIMLGYMLESKGHYIVESEKRYIELIKISEYADQFIEDTIFVDEKEVETTHKTVDELKVVRFEVKNINSKIKLGFMGEAYKIVLLKDTLKEKEKLVDCMSKSGLYKLDIKDLTDDNDQESMAAQYVGREGTEKINVANIEVKDGKKEFIIRLKRSDWMHDVKIEVNGKIVPHKLKVIKTYENLMNEEGKRPTDSEMRFEIPNMDAKIRMYLQAIPMGIYEKVFRIIPQKDTLKLIKEYEETKTQRTEAINRLENAKKVTIDKTKKYTKESYQAYENASNNAKTIDKDTATIEEIHQAAKALEEVIAGLEEVVEITIDKNHLKQEIKGITDKKKKVVIKEIHKDCIEEASIKVDLEAIEHATIEVPVKLNNGKKEVTLPRLEITSNHGNVIMPAGIEITGDQDWNGTMKMPTIIENKDISNIKGTPKMAIKLGLDNGTLTFDKAVKLVIPNQTGKRVAYVTNGNDPVEITHILLADQNNAKVAKEAMDAAKVNEAKLDVGNDLVIWTTHFTTFIIYDESTNTDSEAVDPSIDFDKDGTKCLVNIDVLQDDNHSKKSMAGNYIADKALYEVDNGKKYITIVPQKTEWMENIVVEVNGDEVSRRINEERRDSKGIVSSVRFEVPSIDARIKIRANVEPMGDTRVAFDIVARKSTAKNGDLSQIVYSEFKLPGDAVNNKIEKKENGFYEATIKLLKENEDTVSMIEPYFLKYADVEVKDNKNYVRLFIKDNTVIKDLKVEIDGNTVEHDTKVIKKYENGKKANIIKFEIPNLNAKMKLKAKVVSENNKEVIFRVVFENEKFKKKEDDKINDYLKLLEEVVMKVDVSEDGLYEMTMEVVEKDEKLLSVFKKYFAKEIEYEVEKRKNHVQAWLKKNNDMKDIEVFVNGTKIKYEKVKKKNKDKEEKFTAIRFEVPNADAKIKFNIYTEETKDKKNDHLSIHIVLKKDQAKKIEEKIYLYIHSKNIVDVKPGKTKSIQLDVAPVIESNRTLVPLRGICETLGVKVKWQQATRSILLSDDEMKMQLRIDSKDAKVNEKVVKMDVEPKIINDRTYIPLRFISENLKHQVRWIKKEEKIVITKNVDIIEKINTTKKENKTK